ncbi:MAG: MFS transporter [Candidatus Phaeomarinobacter sp.]
MKHTFLPITVLLLATLFMYMGAGQQGILVPVRAGLEGFSPLTIGLLGSAYAVGFVAGCYLIPLWLRRVGHIRTFGVVASVAGVSILLHGLLVLPEVWFLLRFAIGFSIAGASMVIESWLNSRASNDNRGSVFSVYMFVYLFAVTSGQMSLVLFDPLMLNLFAVSAIMFTLALIPTSLTKLAAPEVPAQVELNLQRLIRLSPVGAAGAFLVGMANGTFGTLGPVFAQEVGFDTAGVALFMSLALVAGAIAQWPFGKLSDQIDRRIVICGVGLLGTVSGIAIVLVGSPGVMTYALVSFFGVAAYSLYGLSVAHANDHADASDFIMVSGGLLVLFGIGLALGPLISSGLSLLMTSSGIFAFTAAMHGSLAVFAFYRMGQRKAVPDEEKDDFVGFARPTSPEAAVLDPRSEEPDEEAGDPSGTPASG